MKNPDRQPQRQLDNDKKRIKMPESFMVGRKQTGPAETAGDQHSHRHDHRESEPAADFAFDRIAIPRWENVRSRSRMTSKIPTSRR